MTRCSTSTSTSTSPSASARRLHARPLPFALLGAMLLLGACHSLYMSTMESLGYEKRELLVDEVIDGRDEQEQAKEQFQSALEAFKAVADFDGGELESVYNRLADELESCEDRAAAVDSQIGDIQDTADALFDEWRSELNQFTDASLRADSERMLKQTERSYDDLLSSMRKAADAMDPVLDAFRNQVLYLKHNLNAAAIASLEGRVVELESDIASLVADMEAAIAEADAFISTLG